MPCLKSIHDPTVSSPLRSAALFDLFLSNATATSADRKMRYVMHEPESDRKQHLLHSRTGRARLR